MFRFNPDDPNAWADAISRHQRGGDGESLATMIRSGQSMPDTAREYVAQVIGRKAKRPIGRPKKHQAVTIEQYAKHIFKVRRVVSEFHSLKAQGMSHDEAKEVLAKKHGTNQTYIGDWVRKPDPDEA